MTTLLTLRRCKMNEIIKYLTQLLNIEANNALVVADIADELSQVQEPQNLVRYIRDNMHSKELDFKTGLQKFVLLTRKYKESLMPSDNAVEDYCKKLAEKCRVETNSLENALPSGKTIQNFIDAGGSYENFKAVDGGSRFNQKEIELLESVGGVQVWLYKHSEYSFLTKLINQINSMNKKKLMLGNSKVDAISSKTLALLGGRAS